LGALVCFFLRVIRWWKHGRLPHPFGL